MPAAAAMVVDDAAYLFRLSLGALAMAVEALGSSPDYFHPAIHIAKHHPGQLAVAEALNSLLYESQLAVPLEEIRGRVSEAGRQAHENHDVVAAAESIQSCGRAAGGWAPARAPSAFVEADRALDADIASVAALIQSREIPVLN